MDCIRDKMQLTLAHFLLYILCTLCTVHVASSEDSLNRCLDGKHHKKSPAGVEGTAFKHCSPWAQKSCCTAETTKSIEQDGVLTLYNMKWNHCSRNLSSACLDWLMKDTCFYECTPNIGPFIVADKRSKYVRKERIINVPLCASECDSWFNACKDDLTCSDNWSKNWKWTKEDGNQCIKECKTFKEHFENSENFCNNIFDRSFEYTHGTPGEDCFSLWPNVSKDGINPNQKVAKAAQKSLDLYTAAVDHKVFEFLDKCVATTHHKSKPSPELDVTECVPWRSHACCNKNITDAIKKDGAVTLFNMEWEHCPIHGNLSKKCRDYFIKDTCFYSCSPNLAPWIIKDHVSRRTRSERVFNIPLCSTDCDGWFEACKDDYTCSDNWGETWKWINNRNTCKLGCKRFKDYFPDSVRFCNKIFNHSFVYTEGEHGKDCMSLWPDSNVRDLNREFAFKASHQFISSAISLNASMFVHIALIAYVALFLSNI